VYIIATTNMSLPAECIPPADIVIVLSVDLSATSPIPNTPAPIPNTPAPLIPSIGTSLASSAFGVRDCYGIELLSLPPEGDFDTLEDLLDTT
jgi:hypothetical protein